MQNSSITPDDLFNRETDGFVVKNILLRACMDLITTVPIGNKEISFSGFRSDKKSIGYVFLCMLVYKALNFSRDIGTTDRIISDPYFSSTLKKLYKTFIPFYELEEKDAIRELCDLYQHTQNKLSQYFNQNNPLLLKRMVKSTYVIHLKKLCAASKLLGYDYILLDMDTLNSYEVVSSFGYSRPIFELATIQHYVDISDVLYCSSLVAPNKGHSIVESREWIIINRSADGLVQIPIDGISFHGKLTKSISFDNMSRDEAEQIWNNGKPVYINFPPHFTTINELKQIKMEHAAQLYQKPSLWQRVKHFLCGC